MSKFWNVVAVATLFGLFWLIGEFSSALFGPHEPLLSTASEARVALIGLIMFGWMAYNTINRQAEEISELRRRLDELERSNH